MPREPSSSARRPPLRQQAMLTKGEKLELCMYAKENPHLTHAEISDWATDKFQLRSRTSESCISRTLQQTDVLASLSKDELAYKSIPSAAFREFDAALRDWVIKEGKRVKVVNGAAIKEQAIRLLQMNTYGDSAKRLTDCTFTGGWLHCFKERHGFCSKKTRRDAAPVSPAQGEMERRLTNVQCTQQEM